MEYIAIVKRGSNIQQPTNSTGLHQMNSSLDWFFREENAQQQPYRTPLYLMGKTRVSGQEVFPSAHPLIWRFPYHGGKTKKKSSFSIFFGHVSIMKTIQIFYRIFHHENHPAFLGCLVFHPTDPKWVSEKPQLQVDLPYLSQL